MSSTVILRQIVWPSPLSAPAAEALVRRLAADRLPATFEARAAEGRVSHFVFAPVSVIGTVCSIIETLTGATTVKTEESVGLVTTARLTRTRHALPLRDQPVETSLQLLAALSAAHFKTEALLLRIAFLGSVPPRLMAMRPLDPTQSIPSKLLSGTRPASGELVSKLRTSHAEPGVRVMVTVGAEAQSESRRRSLMSGVLAAFRTLNAPGAQLDFVRSADDPERPKLLGRLTVRPSEALALVGWPLDAEALPGMPAAHPRQLQLRGSQIDESRVFGATTAPGPERPLGISTESGLSHIHLLGPTGSAKSTAALHLIKGSILRHDSILVLDPKTDLARDTLSLLPKDRWDDAVVIDPSAEGPIVGFSPFDSPGTPPEIIADSVLQILRGLWPDAFGPRTSQATLSALLTLAGQPGATLTMLPRLFDDRKLRERLLKNNPSVDLREFWNMFDALSDGAKAQMIGPVRSRLGQFLLRPQLRRALDQTDTKFHLADLFNTRGRVVVVPLNAGLMGQESSRLAGSLIVSTLQQLTLSRLRLPPSERHPVMIVIDEVQAFLHGTGDELEDALSRSRAAGVGYVLAHQYRSQLSRGLIDAIDANSANKVFWRLRGDDARAVAQTAPELTAEDFLTLPKWGVYAYLTNKTPLGWVSGRSLPPPKQVSDPEAVRRHSLERWGTETQRNEPPTPPGTPPIGRRPRSTS